MSTLAVKWPTQLGEACAAELGWSPMKNFGRARVMALRHRLLIFGILATSTVVALFWGANIGAVYPVIEIVFQKKSLQQEVAKGIQEAEFPQSLAYLERQ